MLTCLIVPISPAPRTNTSLKTKRNIWGTMPGGLSINCPSHRWFCVAQGSIHGKVIFLRLSEPSKSRNKWHIHQRFYMYLLAKWSISIPSFPFLSSLPLAFTLILMLTLLSPLCFHCSCLFQRTPALESGDVREWGSGGGLDVRPSKYNVKLTMVLGWEGDGA